MLCLDDGWYVFIPEPDDVVDGFQVLLDSLLSGLSLDLGGFLGSWSNEKLFEILWL